MVEESSGRSERREERRERRLALSKEVSSLPKSMLLDDGENEAVADAGVADEVALALGRPSPWCHADVKPELELEPPGTSTPVTAPGPALILLGTRLRPAMARPSAVGVSRSLDGLPLMLRPPISSSSSSSSKRFRLLSDLRDLSGGDSACDGDSSG